ATPAIGNGRSQTRSEVPESGAPDRAVGMRIGLWPAIEVAHCLPRRETPRMPLLRVVLAMRRPDVWRVERHGRHVIARAFVHRRLPIVLLQRIAERIRAEVGGVPGQVVDVLVVDDAGIVRSVGAVSRAGDFHQRAMVEELATWSEVDLAVYRE